MIVTVGGGGEGGMVRLNRAEEEEEDFVVGEEKEKREVSQISSSSLFRLDGHTWAHTHSDASYSCPKHETYHF